MRARRLPDKIRQFQARIEPWFATQLHIKLPHSVNDLSKAAADRLQGEAAWDTASTALFGTLGYVGVALSALLVPVFALYLLIDFDRIVTRVEQLDPAPLVAGHLVGRASDIHKDAVRLRPRPAHRAT